MGSPTDFDVEDQDCDEEDRNYPEEVIDTEGEPEKPERCPLIEDEAKEIESDVDWELAAEEKFDVEHSYDLLLDVFGSDLENST